MPILSRNEAALWASLVALIKKKTKDLRFYVDYYRLNVVFNKDFFSLPQIDEELSGKFVFSTLDAHKGELAN